MITVFLRSANTSGREDRFLDVFCRVIGEQTDKLIRIALENKQVKYILKDKDLKDFYVRICKNTDDEKAKAVIKILNT